MRIWRRLVPVLTGPLLYLLLIAFSPVPLSAQVASQAPVAEDVEAPAGEHPLTVEGIPTNLGLAHEMTREVADKCLAALAPKLDARCFQGRSATEHAGNALLDLALAESSRNSGLKVASSAGDCGVELEYRILELRIAYTGVDRSALGFSKEIERRGACVLAGRLLDRDTGEELASTQQEVLVSDRFPYDLEQMLSSDSYPFTSPEIKEKDWSKTAEPIVVTALISGLIYLFFSNQSGD